MRLNTEGEIPPLYGVINEGDGRTTGSSLLTEMPQLPTGETARQISAVKSVSCFSSSYMHPAKAPFFVCFIIIKEAISLLHDESGTC